MKYMLNTKYDNTCSCSLCKTIYVSSDGITNCCPDCEKKIMRDYRDIIVEYHKLNPYATIMDIINSDLLKVPEEYNISANEFKRIVLKVCNAYGSPTQFRKNDTEIYYDSALVRDLDYLKSGHRRR